MEALMIITIITIGTSLIMYGLHLAFHLKEYIDYRRHKNGHLNNISYSTNNIFIRMHEAGVRLPLKPRSDREKEIADKRKDIKQLERQKAYIDELEILEWEEQRLFSEVYDESKDESLSDIVEGEFERIVTNLNMQYRKGDD